MSLFFVVFFSLRFKTSICRQRCHFQNTQWHSLFPGHGLGVTPIYQYKTLGSALLISIQLQCPKTILSRCKYLGHRYVWQLFHQQRNANCIVDTKHTKRPIHQLFLVLSYRNCTWLTHCLCCYSVSTPGAIWNKWMSHHGTGDRSVMYFSGVQRIDQQRWYNDRRNLNKRLPPLQKMRGLFVSIWRYTAVIWRQCFSMQ